MNPQKIQRKMTSFFLESEEEIQKQRNMIQNHIVNLTNNITNLNSTFKNRNKNRRNNKISFTCLH